jgi:hypothetical protein
MQSLLFPIQFAFVFVPVRVSFISLISKRHFFSSESQPRGKFPSETFIVVSLGNEGEKLRSERE